MTAVTTIAAGRGPYEKDIIVLGASGVAASITGTTDETALATITLAAGTMGRYDQLRIASSWTYTNSANNKNLRVRLGGISGTVCMNYTLTTTATLVDERRISNRGSLSSQVVSASNGGQTGGFGSSTSTLAAPAVNTAVATTLVLTGQLANTGETITLESFLVELIRSPLA